MSDAQEKERDTPEWRAREAEFVAALYRQFLQTDAYSAFLEKVDREWRDEFGPNNPNHAQT